MKIRQHNEITLKIKKKCVCVIYQTVWVFRSSASSSTLHVTAVIGRRTFTPLTARRTTNSGHFEQKWKRWKFSTELSMLWTFLSRNQELLLWWSAGGVNSQFWQSCAVSPQQRFSHSAAQFWPEPEEFQQKDTFRRNTKSKLQNRGSSLSLPTFCWLIYCPRNIGNKRYYCHFKINSYT